MSETLRTPASIQRQDGAAAVDEPGRAFGWRRLQVIAALAVIVGFLFPMLLEGTVEGFLLAMAAPFAVGAALAWPLPRTAAVVLGLVSVATIVFSAPYIGEALSHPESAADFVPLTVLTLGALLAAGAAIPAFRQARGRLATGVAARNVGLAALVVAVVAAGVSIAMSSGVDSVAAAPGDHTITTDNFAFAPAKVSADAGTVSVHLTNNDSTRHTFTIDGLVDLSVPPNSTQRASFEAAPGSYPFYCRPHATDMEGVLIVE